MSKPITPLRGLTPTLFSCRGTSVQPAPASMPFNDGPPKRIPRCSGAGRGPEARQPVGEGDGEDVGGMPGVTGRVGRTVGL